jgi:hypothetical protein
MRPQQTVAPLALVHGGNNDQPAGPGFTGASLHRRGRRMAGYVLVGNCPFDKAMYWNSKAGSWTHLQRLAHIYATQDLARRALRRRLQCNGGPAWQPNVASMNVHSASMKGSE